MTHVYKLLSSHMFLYIILVEIPTVSQLLPKIAFLRLQSFNILWENEGEDIDNNFSDF